MLMHQDTRLSIPELESLFPGHPEKIVGTAEDALQSHIIIGFEEALGLGMPPMEALSHVLCWVAYEMARINAEQRAGSAASSRQSR